MEPTSKPIAVISGDIVNSTKLTAEQFEQLLKRIKDIQKLITKGNSENTHSIERGDEFQTAVHEIASPYSPYCEPMHSRRLSTH